MDDVLRQVVHVFADEVKEQAQKIVRAILLMDEDAAQVPVHIEELYRQVHSLKGSSASLGIVDLEQLAHNLEEALMPVRRGSGVLTPALADAALRAVDCARLRAEGLVADNDLGKREVAVVTEDLQRLAAAKEGVGGVSSVEKPPEPAPVPVPAPAPEVDDETLRISTSRLSALERRLDELRAVRGRLDQRTTAAAALALSLERMWHDARAQGARSLAETLYSTLRQMGALKRDLTGDAELAQSNAAELDENLRAMRMVPAVLLGDALHRAAREACRRAGKEARLELQGGENQIDRRLLEELKNPLIHLVRNAVDHGVESAEVREAVGKPRRAMISVALEQRGGEVIVEVHDDGRGIDLRQVQKKAVERGLISADEAERLPERELHELLFRPGFSTAAEVTELSGRGVGLDVVRDAVFKLHGGVEVKSSPGQGTTFFLRVPLTVVASEAMIIEEGGHSYAVPLSSIERIVRAPRSELRTTGGRVFFHLDEQPLPVVRLAPLIGLTERLEGSGYVTVAVMRGAGERAAVVCERLLGSADLVLRPLPIELRPIRLLDSAAILPTGQVLFVLSPRAIVETAVRSDEKPRELHEPPNILVADDSITTRSLLCRVLEASGFRVRTAADGDEALRLAQAEPFDLVVSDVRMPRLDGYALTAKLRALPATAKLPVVLFSSLDSDEDKRRGSASGANAYLTKGAFERGRLLDVVNELLARRS